MNGQLTGFPRRALLLLGLGLLTGCVNGPSQKKALEVPLDMPEICENIDFNQNVGMRETCGVKVRSYRSYKNIAQYRILLVPKNGKIVKKGSRYELRLPQMLPVPLPDSIKGKISFNETARRKYLKSTYDYQEFLHKGSMKTVKIMKVTVPYDVGDGSAALCYSVVKKPVTPEHVKRGYASQIEPLECSKFEQLKKQAENL